MKSYILNFVRRGLIACGFGPVVLAILYLIFQHQGMVQSLTVNEVCLGIFSVSALAFLAGSMNVVYQIERLPLMAAIFIHGIVLYIAYLITYLINDWLDLGLIPIVVFSAIFLVGYILIWAIIYSVIRRNTARLNSSLEHKRQAAENGHS